MSLRSIIILGPVLFGPTARLFDEPGSVDIHVEPPAAEPDAEETIDEIEDVSEQLALHSIISEERHAEILERVEACRNQLEQLSTTESPSVAALQAEVQALRSELIDLKSMLVSLSKNLQPNVSPETPTPESHEEPEPEQLTEEPKQVESPEQAPTPPEPKRKNRFL